MKYFLGLILQTTFQPCKKEGFTRADTIRPYRLYVYWGAVIPSAAEGSIPE